MGIIPLQFVDGQDANTLGLTGLETYTITIPDDVKPGQMINVQVSFFGVCLASKPSSSPWKTSSRVPLVPFFTKFDILKIIQVRQGF